MIQFFLLSQTICMNKASLCLSLLTSERAGEGTGQGEGKRKARKMGLKRRGRSSSLPKSSPESSPGCPKVPAIIAAAPPSADWQTLFCPFAKPHLENRRWAVCLFQHPNPAGGWGKKGNCHFLVSFNTFPQHAFGCLFVAPPGFSCTS